MQKAFSHAWPTAQQPFQPNVCTYKTVFNHWYASKRRNKDNLISLFMFTFIKPTVPTLPTAIVTA